MRGQLLRDGQPSNEALTPEIVKQMEVLIDGTAFVPESDLLATQTALRLALVSAETNKQRADARAATLSQIRAVLVNEPALDSQTRPHGSAGPEQPQPAGRRPRWARLLTSFWILLAGVVVGGAVIPNVDDRPQLVAEDSPPTMSSTMSTESTKSTTGPIQALNFQWAGVEGATGYHVEFHKDGSKVMERDTREPRLVAALSAGEYRWFVWSLVKDVRSSKATVASLYVAP